MVNVADLLVNTMLAGASGWAMYRMNGPMEHPYGFAASAFGLCHGLLGMIAACKTDDEEQAKIKDISKSIMEIVPLSLVNIELYNMSENSNLALGHGLFIIPLAFDILAKLFCDEPNETNATDTLKDLTILGNIASLLYLTVQEGSAWYGGMAAAAFLSRYGAMLIEHYSEGNGALATVFFDAVFFGLTAETVGGDQQK